MQVTDTERSADEHVQARAVAGRCRCSAFVLMDSRVAVDDYGMNRRELTYRSRLWHTRHLGPFIVWYLLPAGMLIGVIAATAIIS